MRAGLGMGLGTLIHLVPQIIILIACIIYMSKVKGSESVLLLIGEILIIVASLGGFVFQLIMYSGELGVQRMSQLMLISSGLSFIGALLFGIGFITLANKQEIPDRY